jgi:hypothetical protein
MSNIPHMPNIKTFEGDTVTQGLLVCHLLDLKHPSVWLLITDLIISVVDYILSCSQLYRTAITCAAAAAVE